MVIHEKLSKEQLLAVAPMVASTQDLLLWDVDAMPQSMAGMDMSHRYRTCKDSMFASQRRINAQAR